MYNPGYGCLKPLAGSTSEILQSFPKDEEIKG